MEKYVVALRLDESFDEKYVKDVSVVDSRMIPIDETKREYETDYTFTYKGEHYRSNEYICRNVDGTLKKPICFRYTLTLLD